MGDSRFYLNRVGFVYNQKKEVVPTPESFVHQKDWIKSFSTYVFSEEEGT